MKRNIIVETLNRTPIEEQTTEIVERKGIGHPDSIADGISEAVSVGLCKLYHDCYGRILHHNTDETMVVGGQSAPKFGGGQMLDPIYILLVGRATTEVNGERLPYRSVAVKAAFDYVKRYCKNLNADWDVMFDCRIGQGSVDLRGVYETQRLLANDTSFGVGFAPFSETELLTLKTEQLINGKLKSSLPEVGEDVKVMAARIHDDIRLTVAAAMVDSKIPDKDHYISVVEELGEKVKENAHKYTDRSVRVDVNTADDYKRGIFYLTVTGLSMENGDDGSVGRGNRANGLITPYRPMSLEATSGKNPVTHVGKIYNLLSIRIAEDIAKKLDGSVKEAHVRILSQIGKPIDEPLTANVQIIPEKGANWNKVRTEAESITDGWLADIKKITKMVVSCELRTF
ncbi:MAG: methionine adenosyltransferase [Euryarchaeota archaeon]|nr:methionine adenosyltransferase [Euryarchaeota archaeon]